MVSYDVTSLYTNIPLKETIKIAVDKIFENNENIKIAKSELSKLFEFATSKTHFQFNGTIYDQIDGIAMGSPLAPALANLFMGFHEDKWLKSEEGNKISLYKRYVDDIFCLVENQDMALSTLDFLNCQHDNIKFTIEKEKDNKLPFLDIKLEKTELGISTSVHKKDTDTGLLTNFSSFVCFKYKVSLIKCLIDRIFRINNSWTGFHKDIDKMKVILQKNGFPDNVIDKNISKTLDLKISETAKINSESKEDRFFTLPYIGTFSDYTETKIKNIIDKYCKADISIKLAFTSSKICNYFSLKDKRLKSLQASVVYKFDCSGCNSNYVGFTSRYLSQRIEEHFYTDKNSHIYKHLKSSRECNNKCTSNAFEVLDHANYEYDLKLKEAMWIKWCNPNLNVQKKNGLVLTINV